ncbi:MAG TPA: hypothetical protein VF188_14390 [Longimicrobiales bacterium]
MPGVSMRPIYFATFRLGEPGGWVPPLEDAIDVCGDWIFKKHTGFQGIDGFPEPFLSDGRYRIQGNTDLVVRRSEDAASRVFGLRIESASRSDPTLHRWAEVILRASRETGELRVAVTLYIGRSGDRIRPLSVPARRPAVVHALIRRCGAFEDIELSVAPWDLETQDVDDFVRLLTDENRRLPVVLCSPLNYSGRFPAAPESIAADLAGIAHVFVMRSKFPGLRMDELIGREFACYAGAVRVYWPGLAVGGDPRRHRFWTPDAIREMDGRFPAMLLQHIAAASVVRIVGPGLRWDGITRAADATNAHSPGAAESNERVERLERRLAAVREDAERQRARAAKWERFYGELRALVERAGIDLGPLPHERPTTVREAVEWALARYGDRITLALNSQAELDDNPFEDAESVRRALQCLATTYHDARTGIAPCPDLDAAFLNDSGFHYCPHQSPVTMGRYANYYQTQWEGESVPLEEHLRKGTSRDPRRALRIAFHFDARRKRIIVGYIGQHQRTAAS